MPDDSCTVCGAQGEKRTLVKCPICFKMFCEACQVNRGGRLFCSAHCAHFFFFGEEE